MKNKLLFTTLLLLLLSFSFVIATDYDYTGETKTIYTNTTTQNPRALSSIAEHNGLTYVLSSSNDNIFSSGIYVYNNTANNYIDSCSSPSSLDAHRMTVSTNSGYLAVTGYDANTLMLYDTTNFCNASYFGIDAIVSIETICGLRSSSHGNDVRYSNGHFYIYGDNGFTQGKSLCIIDDDTPFTFREVMNVSEEIRSDVWMIKSNTGLNDDRIVFVNDGIVYEYNIDGTINEDDYVDAYFPTEIKSGRGFYNQEDNELSIISSKTVHTHGATNLTNQSNFPYIEVLGEYYALNPQCIFDDYLQTWFICTDTRFVVSTTSTGADYLQTACNTYTAQTPCVSECTTLTATDNDFNIAYKYGECDQAPCNMECNSFGQRICDTSRSHITCGNNDADVCWEWGVRVECADGEYCYDGVCELLDFDRLNNELVLPTFTIKPYAVSYEETDEQGNKQYVEYTYDVEPNRLNIDTSYASVVQTFAYFPNAPSTETFYIAKNCDYKENVEGLTTFENDYVSSEWTTTGNVTLTSTNNNYYLQMNGISFLGHLTPVKRSNNEISFDINFMNNNATEDVFIYVRNELAQILGAIYITENDSVGSKISVRSINSSLAIDKYFYNDTGSGAVQNINIEGLINYETDTFTLKTTVQRSDETQIHYSIPFPFLSGVPSNIDVNFISINANTQLKVDNVQIKSVDLLPPFLYTPQKEYNMACLYSSGCYTTRFYLNSETSPMHQDFTDYVVCVNSDLIPSTSKDSINFVLRFFDGLDDNEKYLLGMLGFFVIVGLGIWVTVAYGVKSGGILTGLVGVAWLLLASRFGLLPSFITTILVVMTGLLATFSFVRNLGGGGGGA